MSEGTLVIEESQSSEEMYLPDTLGWLTIFYVTLVIVFYCSLEAYRCYHKGFGGGGHAADSNFDSLTDAVIIPVEDYDE